jgi:N-acetyl sugar amidotransferase
MDTTDPHITFDAEGICSWCHRYAMRASRELYRGEDGLRRLQIVVERVKAEARDKPYDCVIGLSGGVDSTTVAYWVKKLGLRPLAVHLDNGWNSELAVSNIEKTVKGFGLDLHTVVIDWEVFRDLHLSFLKAGVANSEMPTDHCIVATLFRVAREKGIRHIFSGGNITSEAILPRHWGYDAKDWRHIKAIHKRFGSRPLADFPHLTLFDWAYYVFICRTTFTPILNYIDYDKEAAKKMLAREIGWTDYGGKHYESIYTRFFQAYILPNKFGFDKRRAHYSTLINAGQMTRDDALRAMRRPAYPPDVYERDREFVIKKLGITETQFNTIMQQPPNSFEIYPNNHFWLRKLSFVSDYAKRVASQHASS